MRTTSLTHIRGCRVTAQRAGWSTWGFGAGRSSFASLSLSFLLFQRVGDPFIKELGHPLVSLYEVPHPTALTHSWARVLGPVVQTQGQHGEQNLPLPWVVPVLSAASGSAGPPPLPPLLWAPRWDWGRLRTSLASGIKVSRAVSLAPMPAPCSHWLRGGEGEPGHRPRLELGLGGGHRVPGSAGLCLEIALVVETAARGFS